MKLTTLLLAALPLLAADYDMVFRGARVVDGTGNPWYRADVAVKNGRIAAIGDLDSAQARLVIPARARVLAPGFIDVHTHIEGTVLKVPRGDNFLLDGVTTVVTGNCGGSAPDLARWFAQLETTGIGLNVASLIGHNTVRSEVLGRANRQASAEEVRRMQDLVDRGMRDGAVGFSTGLIYIPGTYANTEEILALAKVAAKYGGVYASHMRDEGERVLEAIDEAARIGKEAGMRVQLSHFKIDTPRLWGSSDQSLALVERFRREGVDVVIDQYPYDHSSTNLGITLPAWALADGEAKIRERLDTPEIRQRIAREMEESLRASGRSDYSYAIVAAYQADRSYEGKNIREITSMKGRPRTVAGDIETIFEIMRNGNAQMVFHSMSDEDVERILRYPYTAVASDGGIREFGEGVPHPRSYGTNARVLAEFVRKRAVLRLEDAVRRMTSLPARTFGFRDRGILAVGAVADLVLFDPARVRDRATYSQPHQYAEGFDVVVVNGTVAVMDGKLTEARAGRIVRHSRFQEAR